MEAEMTHQCLTIEALRKMSLEEYCVAALEVSRCIGCAQVVVDFQIECAFVRLWNTVLCSNEERFPADVFEERKMQILIAMDVLDATERVVIKLRYGIEDGYAYAIKEMVRRLRIDSKRIRQIEKGAISKLRQQLS